MGVSFDLEDLLDGPTDPVGSSAFQTPIPAQRQPEFDSWVRQNQINDLDHPDSHYDYRGAFMAGVQPDPSSGHWPDTFKQPGHPTFSTESQYAAGRTDAGTWDGDRFVPPNQNVAPPASEPRTFDLDELLNARTPPERQDNPADAYWQTAMAPPPPVRRPTVNPSSLTGAALAEFAYGATPGAITKGQPEPVDVTPPSILNREVVPERPSIPVGMGVAMAPPAGPITGADVVAGAGALGAAAKEYGYMEAGGRLLQPVARLAAPAIESALGAVPGVRAVQATNFGSKAVGAVAGAAAEVPSAAAFGAGREIAEGTPPEQVPEKLPGYVAGGALLGALLGGYASKQLSASTAVAAPADVARLASIEREAANAQATGRATPEQETGFAYQVLGLQPDATQAEIETAFKQRAAQFHPQGKTPDENLFKTFSEAKAIATQDARARVAQSPSEAAPTAQPGVPTEPQAFELDDLLKPEGAGTGQPAGVTAPEAVTPPERTGHPVPPPGLRDYLQRISDEAVQRGEKPLSPENIEQIVTGQRPVRAEAAPEEGRRVESQGPPEGMPERRVGARRAETPAPAPSVSETVIQKPTVEAPPLAPEPPTLEQPKLAEPFTSHEIGKTLSIMNETDYGLLQRRNDVQRQLDKIPEDKRSHPTARSLADDLDVLNEEVKVRGGLQGAAEELAANQNAEGQPIKAPESPLLADEPVALEQPKVVQPEQSVPLSQVVEEMRAAAPPAEPVTPPPSLTGEPAELKLPTVAPKAKGEQYRVWTPKSGYTEMPGAKPAKLSLPPGFEDMQFMVHKAVGQPGWSVTEASTGANVGLGKTRAAAIETATKALTTVGPEKTLKAIEQTTAKIKAGEAARNGEPVPEPTPADPIEALRQHAQAIAVTEKAIEHGKGADGEPFTPEQIDGFKKDAADQRAQLEQKIEQHAEVNGLKEAEKLRGQIWNEIKNTEVETPKPPVASINPKFKKLDNDALVARQVELEDRIQKDQAILNKGVTPWVRDDPNMDITAPGTTKRTGTSWSRSAMYAKGRINQSGRLLDEVLAEVKDRKITPDEHAGMEDAAKERAAMAAEENAKVETAEFDEHEATGPEAGFLRFPDVKGFLKKYFTSRGNLPEAAFEENRRRVADIGAQEAQVGYTIRDFKRAAKEAYGRRKLTEAERQDLDDALKGNIPPTAVPAPMQPVIASMRRQIDRLSEELINTGVVEGKVAAAITDNLGVYATRAYRVFEDPKWAEKVSDPVKNKAKALLRSEYPGAAPEEIDGLLDELLYRGEDSPLALMARGSTLGSKDLSILQKRKDIAPEIRALWGEYRDPLVSYARSMTKMGHLIANHQFLTEVRDQGLGDFFHEKPLVTGGQSYHTKFASEGSKVLEPLNGLYTTPEIATAFRDAFEPRNTSALMRGYSAVNGAVKYGKTVLSPLTHVRNVLGNVGFAVANGHWRADKGIEAIRSTLADLGLGDTPARRAYLQKMRRLGVIQESTRAGELAAAVNDVIKPGRPVEEALLGARSGVNKLYGVEDDVWKMYAFENERARYARAMPTATPDFLDHKAAEIVQNTYPTFSLVPRGIKALRRFPLLGSFVSFPAEVFRTGFQTLKLAQEELSNPETHAIGAQRLAGITLAAVGVAGLTLGVREMQGWTKDREEALRRFMPPWSENSPLLILGSDGAKVRLIDLGYSDPYSPIRKPILALLRGKDWKGGLARMIVEGAAPFLSEEILAGTLLDVARNKTKTGGRVYNPEDDPIDQASAITDHVWRAVEPGGVSSARRIYKGITGEADEQGRVYDPMAEMAAVATGQRIMHLDIAQAARYKMRQRVAELRDTESRVTSLLAKGGTGKAEMIGTEYRQMDTHRKNVWQELQDDVHAAGMLGLPDDQLAQVLVAGGFSKQATGDILSGQYRPYLPSREFLSNALSQADDAGAGEIGNRIDAIVKAAQESVP